MRDVFCARQIERSAARWAHVGRSGDQLGFQVLSFNKVRLGVEWAWEQLLGRKSEVGGHGVNTVKVA